MSSLYDGDVFERGQWSLTLSQRFRDVCHTFRGTFKLAIQSIFTNCLQRALPDYLYRAIAFNFLFFSIILYAILFEELIARRKGRHHADRDLFDVIRRLAEHIGWVYAVFLFFMVCMLGELLYIGKLLNFPLTVNFYYLICIILLVIMILLVKVPWNT